MPRDRNATRRTTKPIDRENPESDPLGSEPSPYIDRAAAMADIARDALEDCQSGADAERELHNRRNSSGQ